MELNLPGGVDGNKRDFYRFKSSKRKIRKNVRLLLNGLGDLVTWKWLKYLIPF